MEKVIKIEGLPEDVEKQLLGLIRNPMKERISTVSRREIQFKATCIRKI